LAVTVTLPVAVEVKPDVVPVTVTGPVSDDPADGDVIVTLCARAAIAVATPSRRNQRRRFMRFAGLGYFFVASLPPRVRGSALAGVTIVGFWKSEFAGVLFRFCFFGAPPGLTRFA